MRYQSPPCLPQVKQETIRERAARHRQERQAELRSTIDSDARSAAHRVKVQEERAKHGDQTSAQENVNRMVTRWLFPLPVVENVDDIEGAPSSEATSLNETVTKAVVSVYFSYGPNHEKLSGSSRYYTDINVHAKTNGYLPGETVSIVLSGPINKTVLGYVDESGEVCVSDALKGTHIELEGKDIS
ncbi:hypothetical protein ABS858_10855 [Vibrio neptunius]|uniref:hypothetical protein n=1 Tax=Vibrio neptunius TaxID=170651 RepID=UPI0033147662